MLGNCGFGAQVNGLGEEGVQNGKYLRRSLVRTLVLGEVGRFFIQGNARDAVSLRGELRGDGVVCRAVGSCRGDGVPKAGKQSAERGAVALAVDGRRGLQRQQRVGIGIAAAAFRAGRGGDAGRAGERNGDVAGSTSRIGADEEDRAAGGTIRLETRFVLVVDRLGKGECERVEL